LRHRNIVRVEDLTVLQGHCAVVMEFLEGVDCKALISFFEDKPEEFPLQCIFEIIGNVASALHAAYNHVPLQGGNPLELVHRDIKPSNVMVTLGGDVKLLDFGTARANFEQREAKTQALAFGSQAYMAPERFLGDEDTPATDVYSMGITLYELIKKENYGRIDLRPNKYSALVVKRVGSLEFGDALAPEIAEQARAAIAAMVSYGPEDRPSAAQVVELMDVLSEEANDGSLRRFARKHIQSVIDANAHTPDPNDPLTGSTLFEDRSTGFYANTEAEGLAASGPPPAKTAATDQAQLTMPDPSEAFKTLDDVSDELRVPDELVPSVDRGASPSPAAAPAEPKVPVAPTPAPEPPTPAPELSATPEAISSAKEASMGGATERMKVPPLPDDAPTPPPVKSAKVQGSFRPAEIYEPEPPAQAKKKLPMMLGVAALLLVVGGGAIAVMGGGETEPPTHRTPVAPSKPKATPAETAAATDANATGDTKSAEGKATGTESKSSDTKSSGTKSSDTKSSDTKAKGSTTQSSGADSKSSGSDSKKSTGGDSKTGSDSKATDEPAESAGSDATASVEPDEPDEPKEVVAATGSVSLRVLPFGSKVAISGGGEFHSFEAKFGQPPRVYANLPAGSYRATVTRQTDGKKVTKSFRVKAGKTCTYEFNMESYQNGWTGSCK
jgi:serine/threonine protein kinase